MLPDPFDDKHIKIILASILILQVTCWIMEALAV